LLLDRLLGVLRLEDLVLTGVAGVAALCCAKSSAIMPLGAMVLLSSDYSTLDTSFKSFDT
jgi:hypothetical protein